MAWVTTVPITWRSLWSLHTHTLLLLWEEISPVKHQQDQTCCFGVSGPSHRKAGLPICPTPPGLAGELGCYGAAVQELKAFFLLEALEAASLS